MKELENKITKLLAQFDGIEDFKAKKVLEKELISYS
jgi:hypothetical protein